MPSTTAPRPACRLRALRPLTVALVLILGIVDAPVSAQGLPMLPDPVTTRDLVLYADLLGLSDQQRAALEPMQDAYLERFARLRGREIQDFQEQALDVAMQFTFASFSIPERAELEALLEAWDDVLKRVDAVDRTLFDELELVVTDEQRPRMRRVRNIRRLHLYERIDLEMGGDVNEGAGVNLTELVSRLDLDEADRAAADEILEGYEGARLARARRLHDAVLDIAVVVLDTVDQIGLRDMTVEEMMALGNDPETIDSLRGTFDESSRPFQEAIHELSQHNLQTFRRLRERLSEPAAAELRDRYYRRVYGRVYDGPTVWFAKYDLALAAESLSPEMQEHVRSERDRFHDQDARIVEELVELLETDRAYRPSGTLWELEPDPIEPRIAELRQRRADIAERAEKTLETISGAPEEIAAAPSTTGEGLMASNGPIAEPARAPRPEAEESEPDDPFLPRPLTRSDVQQWADHLDWDDAERAVAEALLDDYRARFEEARTAEPADAETDEPAGAADETDERSRRFESLLAIDDALFDELAFTAGNERVSAMLEHCRHARRRQVYAELTRRMMWTGDGLANVDLVDVVLESKLPVSSDETVVPVLSSYEDTLESLFEERFELARLARRRGELVEAAQSRGAQEIAASASAKQQELLRDARRLTSRIEGITRDHATRLMDALPSEQVWEVRYRFNRAAYPDEYGDADEIETIVAAVLDLPDLSPTQRDRVNEISVGFRGRYFDLSDRLIELRQRREWSEDRERGPDRSEIVREIDMESLRFERNEVATRATVRLELALSDEQARRVPGLRDRNRRR